MIWSSRYSPQRKRFAKHTSDMARKFQHCSASLGLSPGDGEVVPAVDALVTHALAAVVNLLRKMVLIHHPDKNASKSLAFQLIQEAYEQLDRTGGKCALWTCVRTCCHKLLVHSAIFQHCRSSFSFSIHANSCQERVCLHRQLKCVVSGTSRTATTSRSTIQRFPSTTTCLRRLQRDLRHVLRFVRPGVA